MPHKTPTSNGHIILPNSLKDRLRLKVGDRIEFNVDKEGRLIGIPMRQEGIERLADLDWTIWQKLENPGQ